MSPAASTKLPSEPGAVPSLSGVRFVKASRGWELSAVRSESTPATRLSAASSVVRSSMAPSMLGVQIPFCELVWITICTGAS